MNLRDSWTIAAKDLKNIRQRKTVLFSIILLPLFLPILFYAVLQAGISQMSGGTDVASLAGVLDSFAFWFVIIAAMVPGPIAAYSIVGEKVEKSLEPLLATPVSDGEILLGKSIAAFVPSILASYAGAALFMILIDSLTLSTFGTLYYPNAVMGVILLLLAPLSAWISIEASVIISARVADVRAAQNLGGIMFFPFLALYLVGVLGIITLDATTLLIISAIFALLVGVLFFVSTRTFRREEILTKWK